MHFQYELHNWIFSAFFKVEKTWQIAFSHVSRETLHAATFWIEHVTIRTGNPVEGTPIILRF